MENYSDIQTLIVNELIQGNRVYRFPADKYDKYYNYIMLRANGSCIICLAQKNLCGFCDEYSKREYKKIPLKYQYHIVQGVATPLVLASRVKAELKEKK